MFVHNKVLWQFTFEQEDLTTRLATFQFFYRFSFDGINNTLNYKEISQCLAYYWFSNVIDFKWKPVKNNWKWQLCWWCISPAVRKPSQFNPIHFKFDWKPQRYSAYMLTIPNVLGSTDNLMQNHCLVTWWLVNLKIARIMSPEKSPHDAIKQPNFNDLVLSSIRQNKKPLNCYFNEFTRVVFKHTLHRWQYLCWLWDKTKIFVAHTLFATSLVPVVFRVMKIKKLLWSGFVKENK